uniref:Uncharacterized protein n=1 Tax=Anguilla anguilla TaxID=7936 RepID=A0A0E9PN12_ANGAN
MYSFFTLKMPRRKTSTVSQMGLFYLFSFISVLGRPLPCRSK